MHNKSAPSWNPSLSLLASYLALLAVAVCLPCLCHFSCISCCGRHKVLLIEFVESFIKQCNDSRAQLCFLLAFVFSLFLFSFNLKPQIRSGSFSSASASASACAFAFATAAGACIGELPVCWGRGSVA